MNCGYSGKCANEFTFGKCVTCTKNRVDPRRMDYYLPIKEGD